MCQVKEENMDHFVFCNAYENKTLEVDWKDIFGHDVERQYNIAQFLLERQVQRENTMLMQKGGQPNDPGSGAPGD